MRHRLFGLALLVGLCSVTASQDLHFASDHGLYGYVDPTGAWIIEPRFLDASGWEDGAARVRLLNGDFAFIDTKGKYLMQPRRFQRLGYLSEGLAVFEPEGNPATSDINPGFVNNVGFLDVHGRIVISPHLFAAYDFSEGVAAASVKFGKCGYIDRRGLFVIQPTFEFPDYQTCGPFSQGLAHVMKDRKYGYINHAGTIVITPHYEYAFDFSEGFAVVGVGAKYGFIDKHGTELGPLSYSYARGFSEGLAWIQVNGKRGYIDSYGNVVVPPQYDDATDYWNGKAEVRQYQAGSEDADEIRTLLDKAGLPVPLRNK